MNIIKQLEKNAIIGKGCNNYPTFKKWQKFKAQKSSEKYLVVNISEGTPAVFKDGWILQNRLDIALKAVEFAIDYFKITKAFIYLNPDYYKQFSPKIRRAIKNYPKIELIKERAGYIGGEESAIMNFLEGKIAEPRQKPPFPHERGFNDQPTLVNNLETFYDIGRILRDEYDNTRLVCFSGKRIKPQVYELDQNLSFKKMLELTGNLPKYDFFTQIGGWASGLVLNKKQLNRTFQQTGGLGAIVIYDIKENPRKLFLDWMKFYKSESCGKCVPCREGTYRLVELLSEPKPDWRRIKDLLFTLEETAFCGLGKVVPIGMLSYMKNIMDFSKIK